MRYCDWCGRELKTGKIYNGDNKEDGIYYYCANVACKLHSIELMLMDDDDYFVIRELSDDVLSSIIE